jgi:hypothetical protein
MSKNGRVSLDLAKVAKVAKAAKAERLSTTHGLTDDLTVILKQIF